MTSKYLQLSNILAEKIRDGVYPVGSNIPTEIELSASYDVSRQTVRQALSVLVGKGLIIKKQGSGNRVVSNGLSLSRRKIAIIASHTNDYIFPAVLRDIQTVLSQNNYSSQIIATHNKISLEQEALQFVLTQSFAGVLAEGVKTALPNPNLALYQRLKQAGIPLVFFHGGYAELERSVCVTDDNFAGGYQLTRYLISKGHTHIGGIFNCDDLQGKQRYQGYVTALRDAGLPVPDDKLLWFSTEDRYSIIDCQDLSLLINYVRNRLFGCTALVVYNDEIAYHMISILKQAGYSLPDKMAVVSFDNSYYCTLSPVPITSLSHDSEKIGIVAANQLLRVIGGKETRSVSVPWKLIERQSG
ncbi:MAG: GntR family transcriptional regulator [Oscillospiraceae bacterium]